MFEQFAADPLEFTDFTETQYVTTGEAQNTVLDLLADLRTQRIRLIGGQQFRDVHVDIRGTTGEATITYCNDTRGVRLEGIDDGKPIVRTDTYLETATMSRGQDGKWRVARLRNKRVDC